MIHRCKTCRRPFLFSPCFHRDFGVKQELRFVVFSLCWCNFSWTRNKTLAQVEEFQNAGSKCIAHGYLWANDRFGLLASCNAETGFDGSWTIALTLTNQMFASSHASRIPLCGALKWKKKKIQTPNWVYTVGIATQIMFLLITARRIRHASRLRWLSLSASYLRQVSVTQTHVTAALRI